MAESNFMQEYFSPCWYNKLKYYINSNEFKNLAIKVNRERAYKKILPPKNSGLLFKAFRVTPYNNVRVVIIGQDPYHSDNQFDGLSFSNSTLHNPQPSLRNILTEVEEDVYDGFNLDRRTNLSLYNWAEQGVLLINAAHTVIAGKPGSHIKYWENFTNEVVKSLNDKEDVVFLLWGKFAQKYEKLITNNSHLIIKTSHPSPLGCYKEAPIPFMGSKCFSKTNEFLWNRYREEIKW